MCNKKASILLEIIVSLLLLSIVSVSAILIYKDFFTIQHQEYKNEIKHIDLLSTKYFLQKNILSSSMVNQLQLIDTTLYFNNSILLKEVSKYEVKITSHHLAFNICIHNSHCQSFKVLL